MRTNIDIDDELMSEAMRRTGIKTKKETVEEALRRLIQLERQKGILDLVGKVHWEGDLDAWREGRFRSRMRGAEPGSLTRWRD